jgi:outer membrane protein assembly factor BamB
MDQRRGAACAFFFALALALAAPLGAGAQRAPLWNAPIEERTVRLAAAAAQGKLVFVAGSEVIDEETSVERAILAALDAATGALVWVAEGDPATGSIGGASSESSLSDLAPTKEVVVAGGFREVAGPAVEGALRAYDARAGTLLWSQQIPGGFLTEVEVIGDVVYTATTLGAFTATRSIVLRALDLRTGGLRWEKTYGFGNPILGALAANADSVAIVGSQKESTDPEDFDLVVRVHDAASGELRFADLHDAGGRTDAGQAAAIRGRRLFVGGAQTPEEGDLDELVIAYDLEEGTRLWTRSLAQEGSQGVDMLAAGGASVVSVSSDRSDYVARSYRAKNGEVQWDTPLGLRVGFVSTSFAVKGRRAVVGADAGVFGLDTRDGRVVWDSTPGGFSAAIRGKTVFVPGMGGATAYPIR